MKKQTKNGFTLVELLAVIVILAIILVIAVPKVMSVIEDSKKATLESTAKMIASSAEKQKVQNTVLGNTDAITCDSVAKINNLDYENCSIEFDGNTAKVTIKGKNKFEGLNVCSGTKTNATAQKEGCIVSTLTVDLDGGSDNNTQYKEKYDAGATVTLTVPTKEYHEFKEWIIVSGTDASVEGNTLTIGKTDTEVKAVWEDLRTYVEFTVTSSNRSKIGYTGETGEVLNIPATFYDEEEGVWYKVVGIDRLAFNSCTALTNVTIPDSVTYIGANAFNNCTALTNVTIPDSVTSIGEHAFNNCTALTNVTIPDSVTSISGYMFSNCESLTSITIPDSVTYIGANAFYGCKSLTSVTIPDGVTSIKNYTFSGCRSLTSVTIPDSVTSIGACAFLNCKALTSITIPDSVTSIDDSAFSDCTQLASVTMPDSATYIGDRAFYECESLTSITIPDGVTSIREFTFYYCNSLTSVTIPDSVTYIGRYAFYHQRNIITDVYYTGAKEQWNEITIEEGNNNLTSATVHFK